MRRVGIITICVATILGITGCNNSDVKSNSETTKTTEVNETDVVYENIEEVVENTTQEYSKVEEENKDIQNSFGTFITPDSDQDKLKNCDFVKTESVHNLYCLFQYNGSEEPLITFESPSGIEYNKSNPSVIYTPKGDYSLGVAFEIIDAEAGQWKIQYKANGSTHISYSVTDITDFNPNLLPQ